jgi:hypothetical protein
VGVASTTLGRKAADSGDAELGHGKAIDIADSMVRGVPFVEPSARPAGFVASAGRHKFHLPDCPWASSFAKSSRCLRFESRKEAVKAGYKQCKTCWP